MPFYVWHANYVLFQHSVAHYIICVFFIATVATLSRFVQVVRCYGPYVDRIANKRVLHCIWVDKSDLKSRKPAGMNHLEHPSFLNRLLPRSCRLIIQKKNARDKLGVLFELSSVSNSQMSFHEKKAPLFSLSRSKGRVKATQKTAVNRLNRFNR